MIELTDEQLQKKHLTNFFLWHKIDFRAEVALQNGCRADFILTLPYINRVKRIAIEVKAPKGMDECHTALGQAITYLTECEESWLAVPTSWCSELSKILSKRYNLPIRCFDTATMLDHENQECPFCKLPSCPICKVIVKFPSASVIHRIAPMKQSMTSGESNKIPWLSVR